MVIMDTWLVGIQITIIDIWNHQEYSSYQVSGINFFVNGPYLQQIPTLIFNFDKLNKSNRSFNEWTIWCNRCDFSHRKYHAKTKRKDASTARVSLYVAWISRTKELGGGNISVSKRQALHSMIGSMAFLCMPPFPLH